MTSEDTTRDIGDRPPGVWSVVALRVGIVAALFSAVVFGLMLGNLVRAKSADAIAPARIQQLKADLLKQPDNAQLKAELRSLDLQLREDYFRSQRFALQGFYLLLGGIAVCLLALHIVAQARHAAPRPAPQKAADPLLVTAMNRRCLAALGLMLGGILVTTAVLARHDTTAAYVKAAVQAEKAAGEREPSSAVATDGPTTLISSGDPPPAQPADPSQPAGLPAAPVAQEFPGATAAANEPEEATAENTERSNDTADEEQEEPDEQEQDDDEQREDPERAEDTQPAEPESKGPTDTSYPSAAEMARNCARFRGSAGVGVASKGEFPTHWDGATGENIAWKTAIPLPGQNSPIVWDDRVFCAGATEQRREVYCFDANTGSLLWQKPVENELSAEDEPPEVSEDTGYAAPTMATDGQRVFAIFANGDLAAFDFSGKQLWTRSMGRPESVYGYASSLLTYPGLVIVQLDQGSSADEGLSAIVALDAASGKRVWETPRPVPNSWSSPIIINHNGRKQIITCGDPWVISYNPATGEEYWRVNCLSGDVAPSPTYAGGLVMVCEDGCDLTAIKPDGSGDVTETHIAWSAFGNMPDAVSPLSDGQLVYVVTSWGMMTCFDMAKGEQLWEQDLGASFYSSPTLVGDLIYLLDDDGMMHMIRPGSEFEAVGSASLGEPASCTPAFANSRIYIRGKEHLFCISDAGTEE